MVTAVHGVRHGGKSATRVSTNAMNLDLLSRVPLFEGLSQAQLKKSRRGLRDRAGPQREVRLPRGRARGLDVRHRRGQGAHLPAAARRWARRRWPSSARGGVRRDGGGGGEARARRTPSPTSARRSCCAIGRDPLDQLMFTDKELAYVGALGVRADPVGAAARHQREDEGAVRDVQVRRTPAAPRLSDGGAEPAFTQRTAGTWLAPRGAAWSGASRESRGTDDAGVRGSGCSASPARAGRRRAARAALRGGASRHGAGRARRVVLLAAAGGLRALASMEPSELCNAAGLGRERAAQVLAALELARRAQRGCRRPAPAEDRRGGRTATSRRASRSCGTRCSTCCRFNTRNVLLADARVAEGTTDACTGGPAGGVPGGAGGAGDGGRPRPQPPLGRPRALGGGPRADPRAAGRGENFRPPRRWTTWWSEPGGTSRWPGPGSSHALPAGSGEALTAGGKR